MSLKNKAITGLAWTGSGQAVKQVLHFVFTILLARLLSPADFGLVGMATVFIGFVSVINEFGLGRALIQRKDVDQRHYCSVFWLNLCLGSFLMIATMLSARMIAVFYNSPPLGPITVALSINFLISAFGTIQLTMLTKEMQFRQLAIRDISAIVVGGVVGIVSAFKGYGVWSLVFQSISTTLTNAVLLWVVSPWRPRLTFDRTAIKDIYEFSANTTLFQVVIYLSRNIDYLIVGKFLGATALGYYTLAFKLMMYPLQNVSWVIGKVMFPTFSKLNFDKERLKRAYVNTLKAVSLATFPMILGLFVLADEFIGIVYGQKWLPSVTVIQIFCACGLIQSINTTAFSVLSSLGQTKVLLRLGLVNLIFATVAVLYGLQWGIYGIALMYTVEQVLWALYCQITTDKFMEFKNLDHLRSMAKIFFMASIMAVSAYFFKKILSPSDIFELLIVIITAGIVYCLALFIFEKDYLKENFKEIIP